MTTQLTRLLLLEDNPGDRRLVQAKLADAAPGQFVITHVDRLANALTRIDVERFDVMLSDLNLPDSDNLSTVQAIVGHSPNLPLVVLTGSNDDAMGNGAIQQGAQDYLVKSDASGPLIARTLRYAIERKGLEIELRKANSLLERRVAERTTELERTLTQLSESLDSAQALIETASDAIITSDQNRTVLSWNRAAERMFGYTEAEALGQSLTLIIPERYRDRHDAGMTRALNGDKCHVIGETVELHGLTKAGVDFPLELSLSAWQSSKQKMFVGIIRDITERRLAQDALESSLRDKDALLKEVHHRVKNNLQVITSLLRLESGRSKLPGVKTVLGDMQGRIRSMALLHETLYRAGTFALVDLSAYLRQLSTQAFRTLIVRSGAIQLHLALASVKVGMDLAMPCGLLVNELITNCLKHGFPGERTGEVRIELQVIDRGPRVSLRVSDTGVGLPEDFDRRRSHSLGLQMVSDLAGQIGGTLVIGPGATFTVTFTADAQNSLPGLL